MSSPESVKPFGVEFLEEMLNSDSDAFGGTSVCTSSGPTYYQGRPVDPGSPPDCTYD